MRRTISITTGPRQSNIELLRILAMLMVLGVHADFWALGIPTAEDFTANPLNAWTRTAFESITIVCVNVFILISGWFGIKFSIRGFFSFIFQCLYFYFSIYLLLLTIGSVPPTAKGLYECIRLTPAAWFIRSYTWLYLMSPILNLVAKRTPKWSFAIMLILFFTYQTYRGWIGAARFIEQGYTVFSFIGLYMIARYTRFHCKQQKPIFGASIYLLCTVVNTLSYWIVKRHGYTLEIFSYINPLVIAGSLGLLTSFTSLKSKHLNTINWIAASAFAAYLLHTTPPIFEPIFKTTISHIYQQYSGIECLCLITSFLTATFIAAILLDQPRKWLWKRITLLANNAQMCIKPPNLQQIPSKYCRKKTNKLLHIPKNAPNFAVQKRKAKLWHI